MKRYYILPDIGRHRRNVSSEFVQDMLEYQTKPQELRFEFSDSRDGYVTIIRKDGKNFRNGHNEWTHNNNRYPVVAEFAPPQFDEELFTI